MKQDLIAILDLGSEQNAALARQIRAEGVYSEVYPGTITLDELAGKPGLKGVILNPGTNAVNSPSGVGYQTEGLAVPVITALPMITGCFPVHPVFNKKTLSGFYYIGNCSRS